MSRWTDPKRANFKTSSVDHIVGTNTYVGPHLCGQGRAEAIGQPVHTSQDTLRDLHEIEYFQQQIHFMRNPKKYVLCYIIFNSDKGRVFHNESSKY